MVANLLIHNVPQFSETAPEIAIATWYRSTIGMNIFNIKAKIIAEDTHHQKWVPAVALGGILRTNVPYVSQTYAQKNATNGMSMGSQPN